MDGTWEVTTDASASGSRCMTIENWTNNVEFNDDFLRSSTMDMSQAEEIHISYKWAYAHKGTSEDDETDDRLRISVTGDCGNDWDLRRMHRGFMDLPSADPTPFPFTPNGPEEWKQFTIVLDNEEYLTEFFRVQFEFESRLGNNIYLDDINITAFGNGTMDLADVSRPESWVLAPNPTTSTSTVAFNLAPPRKSWPRCKMCLDGWCALNANGAPQAPRNGRWRHLPPQGCTCCTSRRKRSPACVALGGSMKHKKARQLAGLLVSAG